MPSSLALPHSLKGLLAALGHPGPRLPARHPAQDENASRLSEGTVLAAVFVNVNLDQSFVYAVDGRVVETFEPDYPETDVAELLPHLHALGMPTDGEEYEGDSILAGLALAERVTGVRLTSQHIGSPRFVADVAPRR
ncbi:DUF6461 domain-containing protein [Sphaerisporangium flaviroseum]|uniref:DUF6461 domain-containing protein n=1 Tax=Sphaerisporangium flaviroseum TaxID=509199 RepID=UPI0031EC11A2